MCVKMKKEELEMLLENKKRELSELVEKKNSLRDGEVYKKSRELDELVVRFYAVRRKNGCKKRIKQNGG
ncbi:MAG: aspartyl-phosphate phosphatase Spo0E family protein [Clostridia bacterium]|nr:aspartyl-phosphate phosphatase Spo0E family protein [Clostridia bacterium]